MRILNALGIASLVAFAGAAWGVPQDIGSMYDDKTLTYWHSRYSVSTPKILDILLNSLTPEEYKRVRQTEATFPLKDTQLVNFYATGPTPRIVLPVSALKFLDDLSFAYAWIQVHGFRLEKIEEYVAMLKYKPANGFPKSRYPAPIEALQIPRGSIANKKSEDLGLRLFNDARAFVLAHELAHIRFSHRGSSISNEIQADQFAMELLRRNSVIPLGAVLYFQATALWFPNRADFRSDQEWQEWLTQSASHPLNGARLGAMSAFIKNNAEDFTVNQPNPDSARDVTLFIATGIGKIADYLEDTPLLQCVAEYAYKSNPDILWKERGHERPGWMNC